MFCVFHISPIWLKLAPRGQNLIRVSTWTSENKGAGEKQRSFMLVVYEGSQKGITDLNTGIWLWGRCLSLLCIVGNLQWPWGSFLHWDPPSSGVCRDVTSWVCSCWCLSTFYDNWDGRKEKIDENAREGATNERHNQNITCILKGANDLQAW